MNSLNAIALSGLRAIEAVGRCGSLTLAAEDLGVTPGALSQRLTRAEAALGRTLFRREASGLAPTEICRQVLPQLVRGFSELAYAVDDLKGASATALTISVAPLFASRWLIWRIRRFTDRHPEISVRIEPTVAILDLDATGVDIGIRVTARPDEGPNAVRLIDQRVFPVCDARTAAAIHDPQDLFRHPVIRENERLFGWDVWLAPLGLSPSGLPAGPTYTDAALCIDAAMTGQGVFMAWETLACDALDRGALAAPFARRVPAGPSYWLVTARHAARKPGVRQFTAWLREELEVSVASWRRRSPD